MMNEARPLTPTPAPTASPLPIIQWGRTAWSMLGIGLAMVGGIWVALRLLVIIVPVTVAVLMSSILWPPARWLRQRGWRPLAATWTVMLTTMLAIVGTGAWIVPTIARQAASLRSSVGDGVTRIEDWMVTGPLHLSESRVTTWSQDLRNQFGSFESDLARGALARTPFVIEIITGMIVSFVLVFFFLQEAPQVRQFVKSRWPTETQARIDSVWTSLTGFSRGLVVNAAINAAVLGISLAILGVPLAAPIAALTFAASFVPLVGAVVSGAVAALVALVAVGPATAATVVVVTIVMHHLEAYVVGPRVIKHGTGIHPAVLIVSLVVGIAIAGVPGGFLAGPVAATLHGWFADAHRNDDA